MTPFQVAGSPVSSRSHPTTTSSTSVSAGADCHVIPSAPSPPAARSPSTEARDALAGNQPKYRGCWTWVTPGTTTRSRSASTRPNGSACSGARSASFPATSPGFTCD